MWDLDHVFASALWFISSVTSVVSHIVVLRANWAKLCKAPSPMSDKQ